MKFRPLEGVFRYSDDCNKEQSISLVNEEYVIYIYILVSLVKEV